MKNYILATIIFLLSGCYRVNEIEPLVAIQIQDRNGLTETISTPDRLGSYESVNFLNSQPYKKVLRVYKKDGKNQSKITTYHSNGAVWQYLEAEEMRAHGFYREWFPNGQLKIEAKVIGGSADVTPGSQQDWLFEGLSQVWNEQGQLIAKIPYQKGMLEGDSIYFYSSGQIEKILPFLRNHLEGEGVEFFADGTLKSKTAYKNGAKHGLSLGYFSNGQPAWIEEHKEGLVNKGTYYNPNGDLVSDIENGGGFQAIFENDALSYLIEFRFGYPEGRVQKYTPSGELESLYHIKNGLKHGEEIGYYLNSEKSNQEPQPLPKLSVNWNDNSIHGTIKTWYNNGQLQSQREFCRNQKMGPSLAWYRNGSLMMLEEYESDRLVKGQYYKQNQKDAVSTINNGNGVASLYDEHGMFLKKVMYQKGKPIDPEE